MVIGLTIKTGLKLTQAACPRQVGVKHRNKVIPTGEAPAVTVSSLLIDQAFEDAAREGFEQIVETAYPEHLVKPVRLSWRSTV